MRSAIAQDDDLDCGEMQYINAHKSKILFMTVGCITMVAIVQNDKDCYSEAFLKIQLEYVYTGIIFTLTDSVQYMVNENPYLDIRDMLGSTSNILRDVLDNLESLKVDRPCLFLGGVQSFPISHDVSSTRYNETLCWIFILLCITLNIYFPLVINDTIRFVTIHQKF